MMLAKFAASRMGLGIVVTLILACSVGFVHSDQGDLLRMIHPTFHKARFLEGAVNSSNAFTLESNHLTVQGNKETLFTSTQLRDTGLRPNAEATSTFYMPKYINNKFSYVMSYVTYDMEREAIRNNIKMVADTKSCHYHSAFRAYEMVGYRGGGRKEVYAIAFSENYACLIEYKDGYVPEDRELLAASNINSTYIYASFPTRMRPLYPVASVAARAESGTDRKAIDITYFDETGTIYKARLNLNETFIRPREEAYSLSSINLGQDQSVSYTFIDGTASSKLGGAKLDSLKKHYDHAFVEAIQLFGDALCWSTGWRIPKMTQIRCIGGDFGVVTQEQLAVRALETYSHNNQYYNHQLLVGSMNVAGFKVADMRPKYVYENSSSLSKLLNNTGVAKDFNKYLLPIDIVYNSACSKLYVIYMHMYQEYEPHQKIDEESAYIPVNWMTFPINAILYHNNRLYLFSGGNRLKITEELKGCSLADVRVMNEEYYQSDLLMKFRADKDGKEQKQLLPMYDSFKHALDLDEFGKASSYTEVPAELRLRKRGASNETTTTSEPPPMTNTTLTPGAGATSGSNSSMIIIVVVIIILVGIICGFIHFFYFARATGAPTKTKSILRKQPSQQDSQTAAGPNTSVKNVPAPGTGSVASTLSPTLTVRSADLHQPPTSTGVGKDPVRSAKSVRLPTKSLKSTRSAKSPARSPIARGPKSAKSVQRTATPPQSGAMVKSVGSVQSKGSHGGSSKKHKSKTASDSKKTSPKK